MNSEHKVYLVYGAPCSGKTTYVEQHAGTDDLIIDIDKLCAAISINPLYTKPDAIVDAATGIRDYLISAIAGGAGTWRDAWVIGGYPSKTKRDAIIKQLNAEPIFIDANIETCMQRAKYPGYEDIIAGWFARYEPDVVGMSEEEANAFYHSTEWQRVRASVLKHDHFECQRCKAKGKYTRATTVHHVKHLRDRPDLATSMYDGDERQLVSLCANCHNEVHPEKGLKLFSQTQKKFSTGERW
jgi:hypothetical protein